MSRAIVSISTSKRRIAGLALLLAPLAQLAAGQSPAPRAAGLEFPVVMRQNVVAGKTPIGTKVQARLAVATLVNGVVVQEGAILSGEVTESAAKSATEPSRLAIRMDSARWKQGSLPIAVYLTAWFYPVATPALNDSSDLTEPTVRAPVRWTGAARPVSNFPDSPQASRDPADNSPAQANKNTDVAPPAPAGISKRRVLMKNVQSIRSNGALTLTSRHANIKLDKQTTYVLAAGDSASGPG